MSRTQTVRAVPHVTVLLCRGCCCGTTTKHPATDHDRQEQLVRSAAATTAGVAVRTVDCLDECDRSNVVVLRGPHGRAAYQVVHLADRHAVQEGLDRHRDSA
jgi:predicted metal-binding protein